MGRRRRLLPQPPPPPAGYEPPAHFVPVLPHLTDAEFGVVYATVNLSVRLLGGELPGRLRTVFEDLLARGEARRAGLPEPAPERPLVSVSESGEVDGAALRRAVLAAPPWERPGLVALATLLGVELPPDALAEAEAADRERAAHAQARAGDR